MAEPKTVTVSYNEKPGIQALKNIAPDLPPTQEYARAAHDYEYKCLVLDNHSAHTSKETQAHLKTRPGRFEFVFAPTHGSWLNLVESFSRKPTKQGDEGLSKKLCIEEASMGKYSELWKYIAKQDEHSLTLTFDETKKIAGVPIDHSFLNYKKELVEFGWQVGKISMKQQTVIFEKKT